jgi:hypothetical protein
MAGYPEEACLIGRICEDRDSFQAMANLFFTPSSRRDNSLKNDVDVLRRRISSINSGSCGFGKDEVLKGLSMLSEIAGVPESVAPRARK